MKFRVQLKCGDLTHQGVGIAQMGQGLIPAPEVAGDHRVACTCVDIEGCHSGWTLRGMKRQWLVSVDKQASR